MPENTDERERGFLTKKDRRFLRGELEYDHEESAIHRRADIRERTKNAFIDFTLLYEELDEKDREKIFDGYDENPLHQGVIDTIAFIALGLSDNIVADQHGHHIGTFEQALRSAFFRVYPRLGFILDDMDIRVTSHHQETVDFVKENLREEDGNYPTPEMVKLLVQTREIDWDNLREFLHTEVTEETG